MSLQEEQDKALKMFENILNKEALQTNILGVALFVLFFEQLKDFIIDRPRGFYCFNSCEIKDEKIIYKENDAYKQKVRSLDPQRIFHASVQWFQKQTALSEDETLTIFKAEKRRNDFVHEFFRTLTEGWRKEDSILLREIISLYQRLDSWWVYNFEFDEDEVPNPETVTQKDCYSLSAAILNVVKDIALGNDEPYSDWMEQIREAVQQKAMTPAIAASQSTDEKKEGENEKI